MKADKKLNKLIKAAQELAGETALTEERIKNIVMQEMHRIPPIQIKLANGKIYKIEGKTHPKFEKVLRAARTIKNVLLIGETGTGKTYLSKQIAEALKARKFGTISVSPNMSESWLLGRYVPDMNGGRYIPSDFIDIFENGGVFLIDEMGSAGSGDVMMVINQALANGRCPVPMRPEKPVAERHEDCIIIGATNVLTGADNIYTSQTGLEGSTKDRFTCATYKIEYDTDREKLLTMHGEFPKTAEVLWKIRKILKQKGFQQVVSSRTFENIAKLKIVDETIQDNPKKILEEVEFWNGWNQLEINDITTELKKDSQYELSDGDAA